MADAISPKSDEFKKPESPVKQISASNLYELAPKQLLSSPGSFGAFASSFKETSKQLGASNKHF